MDSIDPRLVPSNKSVGTLRYISNRPIHRKLPLDIIVIDIVAMLLFVCCCRSISLLER